MTTTDDNMPTVLVFVVPETLSDKSKVYNVVLGEHKWAAQDYDAAVDMANAIVDAINEFGVHDTAEVIDETDWKE